MSGTQCQQLRIDTLAIMQQAVDGGIHAGPIGADAQTGTDVGTGLQAWCLATQ
jgi:hypothetical protein